MPAWLLIDGSSLIFRAFYGAPRAYRSPDGRLVNAVRGFQETLTRLLYTRRPRRLAVATDEDWRPEWRVELLPSYKTHRTAEPVPPELIPQLPVIMAYLAAVGIDAVGAPGYEAEDVIATLVEKVERPVEIVSGDRDLFALVRDAEVVVLYPEKAGLATVDEAEVERRYGVPGRAYADYAVLRGDPSDGLPGLAGVGPKKAADLLRRHGSLRGMLEAGLFRSADREYLERALKVVAPVRDVPVAVPSGRRDSYPAHPEVLQELNQRHGLAATTDKLVQALTRLSS
ncbi:MAG TPA: 5'-3' exonuclease [Candidatus Acidoferrales bacterium]|nr:5'-3' exonuclease [Candidatus Acidoferrales bacterium]